MKTFSELGEELRSLRLKRRISQKALAKAVGLRSAGAICNIELGRNPASFEIYRAIALELGGELNFHIEFPNGNN